MVRALLALGCLTGCVTSGPSFTRGAPEESALVYGFLRVDGKPAEQLTLGQRGTAAQTSSALLDGIGNFAFIVPPGAWFSTSPAAWQLELQPGELRWVGAFEQSGAGELKPREDIAQRDVLQALMSQAGGTPWEPVIRRELARLATGAGTRSP